MSDDWGMWRTGLHYQAKDTPPLAIGSRDGLVKYAHQDLQPSERPRPFLARRQSDGKWRAMGFAGPNGYEPVSPHSNGEGA